MNQRKQEQVANLKALLQECPNLLVINYTGFSVSAISQLRAALRSNGASMLVARNTLMAVAADQADRPALKDLLGGQIAFISSADLDAAAMAKAYMDSIKASGTEPRLIGGITDAETLTEAQVKALSKIPPREVLIAQFLASLNAPIAGIAVTLNSIIASLPRTLNAIAQQKQNN